MKLPATFSYNPQVWVMKWNLVTALAITGLVCTGFFKGIPWMIISAILFSLVGLLEIRRRYFPKTLVLNHDAIILPLGFLQQRTVRIPYDAIVAMWERRLTMGTVLYLRDGKRKYELACGIRMTTEDYVTIRNFLFETVTRKAQPSPPPYGSPAAGSPSGEA